MLVWLARRLGRSRERAHGRIAYISDAGTALVLPDDLANKPNLAVGLRDFPIWQRRRVSRGSRVSFDLIDLGGIFLTRRPRLEH